ncbi:hypothetical protein BGZ61DRAFT_434371 [Ilyonectria robusta]|uniref:uncharacterized protein n=1 Tax=Ilyonectria robusta TaxID=1079257 RepID=UPI001E8E05D6|nr:uncharacterized protein BGZ61DRAFT_434371 [Ilyonectria robusta]KAH8656430.1 hypothetical protein BGZ61DRAFT_434371 [Ilyonectria robusta]
MATTVSALLGQYPTNPVKNTLKHSDSNKSWAKSYPPISRLRVHTSIQGPGSVIANFNDAFLGEYNDETLRLNETAHPPNYRRWRLDSEEDGIQWFHTEISNVVLSAFASHPSLLQTSHEKALSETRTEQTVDISYSVSHGKERMPVAIGEFKRGLIKPEQWQNGKLIHSQQIILSQELRGYAHKYACPQVFCFDNYSFLMLQFRARNKHDIKDAKCDVDCWILPREDMHGCYSTTLRYALYRLLVQGFRRCQGARPMEVSLYGIHPHVREFYNGQPLWKIDGKLHTQPGGHCRLVDPTCGAFFWTDSDGSTPLLDQDGNVARDTEEFWESSQQQTEPDNNILAGEDLYGPG